MSKILRQKSSKTPQSKKTPRKSRRIDDSSDDDYSGVDLVSDSEDEDADVRAAEEAAIIESEYEDDDVNSTATPRPNDDDEQTLDDDHSSWGGFDVDSEHNGASIAGTPGASDFFNDAVSTENGPQQISWDSEDQSSNPKQRRVHFASDSSSEDSDIDDDIFPDIFLEQDRLDPRFRREIENDCNRDNLDNVSDDGSFWDFNADNNGHDQEDQNDGNNGAPLSAAETSEEESSSDYDTDEGETTEEDIDMPTPNRFVNAKSVLRRASSSSSSSEEEIQVTRRSPYPRRGPQLGTWFADSNKPYAIVDTHSKKLIVVKGRFDARRASFSGTPSRPLTSFAPEFSMDESPMISNSGNVMMSAMSSMYFDANGASAGPSQAMGPPEAWFPFVSIDANGAISQDDHSSYDEDDVDEGDHWDIQDLLDFGDDGSEEEDDEEDASDGNGTEGPSTPGRPLSSEDQVHPLLEHFDRTSVNAFRRNQNRHALITRNTASKDSLAFSGAFGAPIRGIKSDRMAAANVPITPVRRTKASRNVEATPSSPAAKAVNTKRKFSGEQHGHKRSRSMV